MRRSPPKSTFAGLPRSIKEQANDHRLTRYAHAREIAEDYVEAIADLAASHEKVRVTDLAKRLGVTHVTVIRTLARLRFRKLVRGSDDSADLKLTKAGKRLSDRMRRRHQLVAAFLRSIGVSVRKAERDAEGIEHHVSEETLRAFARSLRTIR
jgi:DtxR family manganese transport transcriptional regulator